MTLPPPRHGGDLDWASETFGVPGDRWQDLSTGISPWVYPAPPVPPSVWQRLPDQDRALQRAAADYYGVEARHLTALPGSQFALARIPRYLSPASVALPAVGYAEHRRAWMAAGHQVLDYRDGDALRAMVAQGRVQHLVLINPNNPSAERWDRAALAQLYREHGQRGILLVDEAFADLYPELSALALIEHCPDLWVLRSVGKFFALAGLRLGFLAGQSAHWPLAAFARELAPWGVSHPAQWLGARALADTHWQARQRRRLTTASAALARQWRAWLTRSGLGDGAIEVREAGLFVTLRGPRAPLEALYQHLARAGVLLRWGHEAPAGEAWLRSGLPPDAGQRLAEALTLWRE